MAKSKKSKENNIVGSAVTRRVKRKRFCRRDSAGTVEADAAAGGAGDTVFVDLAGGLGPSTAL